QLLASTIELTRSGEIRFAVHRHADRTHFELAGDGRARDEDSLRPSEETLGSVSGHGIGLAIALRLSLLIGASLTVKRAPDGGATLMLSVPEPLVAHATGALGQTLH